MAGYIINLDNIESLRLYAEHGIYATKLNIPNRRSWRLQQEGTFADYATMKEGDNIYFFIERKIYGIGELKSVGGDCKYSNFNGGCMPGIVEYEEIRESLLLDEGEYSQGQRWVCLFKPSPYFFTKGVDMDDALASNPDAFKMLRAFWKLSFIKFDDEENQAFKNIILKYNQECLDNARPGIECFEYDNGRRHQQIERKLEEDEYSLDIAPFLNTCNEGDFIRHEMAIEAALLYQLAVSDNSTTDIFGDWDYITHQVIASPFKPIDYMDKMDIFGYSYIEHYKPTISKYLVAEIKKDSGTKDSIDQLLKYVDWVNEEYTFGDYKMINAFLIAYEFPRTVVEYARNTASRKYIKGRRPAMALEWNNLILVKYRFNETRNKIDYEIIN